MADKITRRNMIVQTAAGVGAAALSGGAGATGAMAQQAAATQESSNMPASKNGRVNQSVCQWCFKGWDKEEFCSNAQKLGLKGIDLVGPDWFDALKKHNLVGTMTPSHGLTKGLNRKENWDECLTKIRASIDATAEAGFPNVICFSGNRGGMDDDEGLKNCAEALKQVVGLAEQKKVTICMELLNSKVNHKDYMADRTAWGAKLVDAVGSDRFKLLYDIYHMQVDEGDVIATIRKYKDRIGHYHTAGVPGRNELDENQELFYPAIMRAIVDLGFKGYVAQEFVPKKKDHFASLAQAVQICDV
ncbi:MAG TPA: TIM barrel protein [Tepidisphaeraceae bacterium]|nr:TIM barrel protein [Tepidisphaeraceae bacterium]